MQLLQGLCELAKESMNDSVDQFLSSFFVSTQLQSPPSFLSRINAMIDQSKSNALNTFTNLLLLLRATNQGNAIITAYGTNFEYVPLRYDDYFSTLITQPVIYENNCSCALNASCSTRAVFIGSNSSLPVVINGLKMGCTPSESLLSSTLECFYEPACLNLIEEYASSSSSVHTKTNQLVAPGNTSQFSVNTSVRELVELLFIEKWSTAIDYSAYFNQCAPMSCSYDYIEGFSSLYTVTVLLGFYGGLSFVLRWICPSLLSSLHTIYRLSKKWKSTVTPTLAIGTPTGSSTSAAGETRHMAHWYLFVFDRSVFHMIFAIRFLGEIVLEHYSAVSSSV